MQTDSGSSGIVNCAVPLPFASSDVIALSSASTEPEEGTSGGRRQLPCKAVGFDCTPSGVSQPEQHTTTSDSCTSATPAGGPLNDQGDPLVSPSILPGLSNDWFTCTAEGLLEREVSIIGRSGWNATLLQDAVLELSSHERRIDSVIRSKVILKKDLLYGSAPRVFELSSSVSKGIMYAQQFQNRLKHLREAAISGCLVIPRLLLAQRRAAGTIEVLDVLDELSHWESASQTQMVSEQYEDATSSLMAFQRLLFQHEDLLMKYPTSLLAALKARATVMWTTLYQNLLAKLDVSLQQCLRRSTQQLSTAALEECLRALCFFKSKESSGVAIVACCARVIPEGTRRRLLRYADAEWLKSADPDARDVAVIDVCQHITSVRVSRSIQGVLEFYLNVWITYAEIVLWARKRSQRLEQDKREQWSPERQRSSAELANDVSDVEFLSFLRAVVGDMNLEKDILWNQQEQYLLLMMQSLTTVSPLIDVKDFFKVSALIHRFCVEVYAVVCKQPAQWETVVAFQHMQLPATLEEVPMFTKVANFLTHLSKVYFRSFLSEAVSRLRTFLAEDGWQRLPILDKNYEHLVRLPPCPAPPVSLHQLGLWDGATYPTYCTRRNPFLKWKADPQWAKGWSFVMDNTKRDTAPAASRPLDEHSDTSDVVASLDMSNHGPVVSASSRQLFQTLNVLIQLAYCFPSLHVEVISASMVLLDIFIFSAVHFFSSRAERDVLLNSFVPPSGCCGGAQLYEKHRTFLLQRGLKELQSIVKAILTLVTGSSAADVPHDFVTEYTESLRCGTLSADSVRQQLGVIGSVLRGFVIDPVAKLDSPGALWGLAERVVAVEGCVAILNVLRAIFLTPASERPSSALNNMAVPANAVFRLTSTEYEAVYSSLLYREQAVLQLREFIYTQAVETVFDLEPFTSAVCGWNWDIQTQDLGLAIDQLRVQLQDLGRRIACCGGGSIPHHVQVILWHKIGTHSIKSCALGMAKNPMGFPQNEHDPGGPPPSLLRLCQNFRQFLLVVSAQIAKVSDLYPQQPQGLRPLSSSSSSMNNNKLSLQTVLDTSYLDVYIQGHSLRGPAAFAWCKMQTEYDIFMLTQLLRKTEHHSTLRRSYVAELEMAIVTLLRRASEEMSPPIDSSVASYH